MLTRKQGIAKIQLTPSMHKVPASRCAVDDFAVMIVVQQDPSDSSRHMAKFASGETPCKSFAQPRFKPSGMVGRLKP